MMIRRSHRGEVRGGFTLMEVMVVVAIIVLLAAAAAPLVFNRLAEAKISRAKIDCEAWSGAVMSYKVHFGDFPPSLASAHRDANGWDRGVHGTEASPRSLGARIPVRSPRGRTTGQYGKPDIYSLGPTVGNAAGIVGNW